MGLLDATLATKGVGAAQRLRILSRHLYALARHATPRRLLNFVKAERGRAAKKTVLDSWPYILKIEPSNICNLRCAYCYDNRRSPEPGERPYGRMGLDQFKGLIDEIGEYLFKINLYGFGEPFLFPETLEMIRYAADRNIGVGVSSNLNIRDPDLPGKIMASGLEVLIFSCHGVSRETYGKFMDKGDAELALSNVRAIAAERRRAGGKLPFIDWQYCVTGFNEAEIPLAREKAREMGVDQIRFIRPYFPEDAPDEWFSTMFPRRTLSGLDDAPPRGCSWLYRSAYVNFDGGLLPCCRDFRKTANDFGNVFRDGFKALWNGPAYVQSRALLADPSRREAATTMCARCPASLPGPNPRKDQT